MLLLVLSAALLLGGVQPSPDENLAVGRPSLVSSSAVPPSSCTSGSHLEVDAGVANVSDDCGCVLTGGWTPPNLRDWYAVQLAATSLVRGVRLTGVVTSLDVLVGDDFSANMSLDAFSLCATNVSASSAQNVSCTRASMGSVVVVRALDDSSPLRLCEVKVIGLSWSVLLGSTDSPWQPPPSSAIPQEQLWRLADGDVSSCADLYFPALFAYGTATRIRIPAGKSKSLQVFVYHHNVPSSAFVRDSCREARFSVSIISDPSPSAGRGAVCDFVYASAASSFAQFECSCPQACQGELALSTFSRTEQTWTLCEVIVTAPEATPLPLFDECAAPMGSVRVSGDMFDDMKWSAPSAASGTTMRYARLNAVPGSIAGWCPSTATPSWIALDLGTPFKLRAVVVQGSGDVGDAAYTGSYVTSFSVSYALGQAAWTGFAPSGSATLFSGPSHQSTPVLRSFSPEIVASRIRLDVLQWVKYPCVRFELIGCPLVNRAWTASPIPSVSGAFGIPTSALSVSSSFNGVMNERFLRLTSSGWLACCSSSAGQWVEMRLDSSRTVHGIACRGGLDSASWQYVTTYDLQFKFNDSFALTSYSTTPVPTYAFDNYNIIYNNFIPAFDAQTVRLVPIAYTSWKALRVELYTAPVRPTLVSKKDTPCPNGHRSLSGSGCYRYVNQTMTYSDADQFCNADSGHLARVTDYDEWNALTRWIPRQNTTASCVWIGGQSTGSSNDSFRLPGIDQVLSVWNTTMPVASLNATGPSALCLPQAVSFALAAAPVSEQHQFLCEKDLPSSPPTPVGLWPFNAFNGFRDLSPFRQHATPGSSVTSAGHLFDPDLSIYVFPAMVYLDNTANAYVDMPMSGSVDLSRDVTIMLYFYVVSQGPLVYFRDPAGLVAFFGLRAQGSALVVDFPRQSDRHLYTCSGGAMPLNAYYTVAATYSRAEGKGRVYVNGRLTCTADVGVGEQLLVSNQLRLGASNTAVYSPATSRCYHSCLQLYDRVLRLHEMDTAMRRCGRNTLQGLLGFWPLNSDLSNYVHRLHPATSPTAQFVPGPSYLNPVPVSAVQTDGSISTALTVAGPLNVNGPFTLLLHAKTLTSTGTIVALLNTTFPALSVTTTGSNVSVAIAGSTVATGSCLVSGQWSQLVLRVDVLSSTLSVHCNGSQTISASLTVAQLYLAQSFTQMQLCPSVSASLSCVLLFERILTPLEISSYLFYCPFQPDTSLPKRSPPRRHCGEWLSSGFKRSDLYVIDPDGTDGPVEPFTVFCDMSDSNDVFKAATVVRHMIPARTLVNGNAAALSIQFPISYEANTTQLKALMSVSAHCRQWLQYECNGSAIYSGTTQMAGWYSRMNDLQPGWSGTPTGATGCACFRRGQCAGGATAKCNCDLRDTAWRLDGGWIEDMDLLPVSKLAFGDATMQNGLFTLGNLTCYG